MPPPATLKRGVTGTGKVNAERIRVDMDDTIHYLDPTATPFTLLLQKIGSQNAENPEFKWMEKDYVPFKTTLTALHAGGATTATLDVTDATIFRLKDVITVPADSSLTFLVTAVDDGANTIAVLEIGGANMPALTSGSTVLKIGNAFPEGTNKREILTRQVDVIENYTQIFKYTFGVTGTAKAGDFYGGNPLSTERKEAAIVFAIEKEKSFWWGRKYKIADATSGQPQRFMNGVLPLIETYGKEKDNSGAALTKTIFDTWLSDVFHHGAPERYIFCSESLITWLSGVAATQLNTFIGEHTYGLAITEYVTPAGKKCYLINNTRVFEDGPYQFFAVALDLSKIRRKTLRTVMLETNVQENGEDSEQDQYKSEESLQLMNPEHHGWLHNFTI